MASGLVIVGNVKSLSHICLLAVFLLQKQLLSWFCFELPIYTS